jgi:hypothetical protein
MMPPDLSTRTRATVGVHPQITLDGAVALVVVIKQQYSIIPGEECQPMDGARIRVVDDLWEPDAEQSSIRYPGDVSLEKPSTDVVIVGEAVSRDEVPRRELDVRVQVGSLNRALRVFGTRVWYKAFTGMAPSDPLPFVRRELRWESAWGGLSEPRNPLGLGADSDLAGLVGKPVASIEDPSHLIRSPKTRPPPAGVGAIGANFAPRLKYAGTMDQRWQEERMPLRPLDFDPRFFQVAAPELIAQAPMRGGEPARIEGMHPLGAVTFSLPKAWFGVGVAIDRGYREYRPMLDTVLIEPEALSVDLTWRSVIPTPTQSTRLRAVEVWEKESA